MTYEELKSLPLMTACIRETLRMHPPIHSIMRKVVQDIPVPPTLAAPSKDQTYVVPKGYFLLSSPLASQMDPQIWKDADEWNPFRWLDNDDSAAQALKTYDDEAGEKVDYGFGAISKGTESPYQPFGAGRHRCIGEQVHLPRCISLPLLRRHSAVRIRATGYNYRHSDPEIGIEDRHPLPAAQLSGMS